MLEALGEYWKVVNFHVW